VINLFVKRVFHENISFVGGTDVISTPFQIRVWSGTLHDDKDFEQAIQEILPTYALSQDPSGTVLAEDTSFMQKFEGLVATDNSSGSHPSTQNAAFIVNLLRFDVCHQLRYQPKDIKVQSRMHLPSIAL